MRMNCACTHMSCEFVFCPHLPSDVGKFISRPTETGLKMITNGQTAKNARNSNFLSSICCVPNLWTKTMATKATYFPALVYRTSSLFEDRLQSHILQFLRTLVLFFCLTCLLRGMVLYSCWVLAIYSSCNLLHSLFAGAKSGR